MEVVRELAAYLRPGPGPHSDPVVGWPALLTLADQHQLLPSLWSALRSRGVHPLPEDVGDRSSPLATLERAYRDNAARVDDLRSQAVLVLDLLDARGIDAVAMKGAHWLMAGWQRDPGARVLVDIDIVIPPAFAGEAMRALTQVGYAPVPNAPDDDLTLDHQLVALAAPGHQGSIELHLAPIAEAYAPVLDAEELRDAADSTHAYGRSRRVPSSTHAMVLLISHAQLQDANTRLLRLPLRALRDLAVLVDEGHASADWDAVGSHFARAGAHASVGLAGFAVASAELFGVELPLPTRGGAAWLHAAQWATDHGGPAGAYRELVCLPRGLRAERMQHLYGAVGGTELARARLRHLTSGAMRRVSSRARPNRSTA
jgi:hypothetical protein